MNGRNERAKIDSSSWTSIGTHIVIAIFWGAWFAFNSQNTGKSLETHIAETKDLPSRVSVIESKFESLDDLSKNIGTLSNQLARLEGKLEP